MPSPDPISPDPRNPQCYRATERPLITGHSSQHSLRIRPTKLLSRRAARCLSDITFRVAAAGLALFALFGFNPQSLAATYVWTGATDANWADMNWTVSGLLGSAVPGPADTALFNNAGGGFTTISLGTGVTVGNIQFHSANVAAYTIGSGGLNAQALTLNDAGTVAMGFPVLNNETFDAAVTLGADATTQTYTFTNNSLTNSLIFAGNITGGSGGTAGAETLLVNGAGNTVISGNIAPGGATGMALTKTGAGTLSLSGTNTYTGATTVNAGTLSLLYSASGPATNLISATSPLSLGGGTLNVSGSSGNSQAFASTALTSGQSTISVTANGTAPAISLGAITVSGAQGGGGATLEIPSTGTVTTTTLGAAGDGVLGTAAGANSTQGYATYGLYDWATTDTTAGAAGTSPATIMGLSSVTGGYVTALNNNNQGQTQNLDLQSNLTVGANDGEETIRFNTPAATTLNIAKKWLIVSGVLITPNMGANNATFIGAGGQWFGDYSTGNAQNVYVWQNNTLGYFINAEGLSNGRNSATTAPTQYIQSGPGTVVQTADSGGEVNDYTGQSYLNGGSDVISADSGLGNPSTDAAVNLNGGALVGNATFTLDNNGATPRLVNVGNAGGGIAATGTNTLTVDGKITGVAGGGPLIIGIPASSANSNTAGLLPGSGPGTANTTPVMSTGTVILDYANGANGNAFYGGVDIVGGATLNINSQYDLGAADYGGLTFNNGTLQYSANLASGAAGSALDITTNGTTAETVTLAGNATIDTNGHAITYANSIGNGGSGSLTVASTTAGGSLTLSANDNFSGAITVNSGASLTLSGSNVNTGPTAVNGSLTLNSGGSLGNSAVTLGSGATLLAKAGNNGIGVTAGAASLTLSGGSTLSMVDGAIGTLTIAGGLTIGGATPNDFDFELNSTSSDSLILDGSVGGSGSADIFITTLGSTAPANGQQYTLISGVSGLGSSLFTLGTTSFIFGNQSYSLTLSNSTGSAEILTANFSTVSTNYYWTGATSTWGTVGNFATDHTGQTAQTTPISASSNIFLTADTASNFSQTLDGNYTVNSLSFTGGSTSAATNSITLASGGAGNNVLTITAGNTFSDASGNLYSDVGIEDQAGSAAHTISANIDLGSSQKWEIDSSNPLLVSGTIANGSTADALTKTGNGTLILSASNTYTGGTTVSAGTLMLGATNALLPTGNLTVNGAGTFNLAGYNQSLANLSDGGVATGTITASTGTSNLIINGGGSFSGAITGAVNVTQNGAGTLTLSGANTYTGLTTVNSGILVSAANSALGNSASPTAGLLLSPSAGTATVDFTSSNPSIASLASSGAGTSTIVLGNSATGSPTTLTITGASSGAGTTFAGVISDLTASNPAAIGNLTVSGGALTLSGTNTFTGTALVNGSGSLLIASPLALQDATLDVQGSVSITTPTTLTLAGLIGSQNFSLTNASAAAVGLTFTGAASSLYTGNLGGLGGVTINDTGTIQFGSGPSGGASYAGPTTINSGTLIIGGTAVSTTAGINLTGANAPSALTVQDNAVINSGGEIFIQSAAGSTSYPGACTVLLSGSASVTVANLSFGNGSRVTNDTLTIQNSASLIDNGFFDFDYNAGGGTVGTPTTFLNGGTLAVQKFQMTATPGAIANPAIHFNGGTVEALASDPAGGYFFPIIGGLVADVDAGGLNVNTNGFNVTIAQSLVHGTGAPDGGLTKSGSGILYLTGTNTYTGGTRINGGELNLQSATALPAGGISFGGGALQYSASNLTDYSGIFANSTGPISIDTNGQNVTFATPFAASNTGGFTVMDTAGTGSLTFSNSNSYTGPTSINSGAKLILASGVGLGNTAIASSGTLLVMGNDTIGNGGASLNLNSGSTLSLADGAINTLTLNGGLTIGGASAANLDFELNGAGSDTIDVSGALAYGAAGGVIYLTALNGSGAPAPGQQYILISDPNGVGTPIFSLGTTQLFIGGANYTLTLSNTADQEILTISPLASALNYYFTGSSTPTAPTGTWSNIGNFATDHTGATAQTGSLGNQANVFLVADNATSNSQTETLDGSYNINSLSFTGTDSNGNTPAALNSISVAPGTGGSLTLSATSGFTDANSVSYPSGTGLVVQAGSGSHSISANINLNSSQNWEINNSLSSPLTVSGVIADAVPGSNIALTKSGPGALVLNNTETYDGGTVVNGGTLAMGASGVLPAVGTLTVTGSGTFDVAGTSQTIVGLSDGGAATATITNSAASASVITINNASPALFRGTITDNGATIAGSSLGLTINGPSTVTLSGSNSYNGLTTVNGGTLIASNNYALGNSASANGGLVLLTGTAKFISLNPNVASLNTNGSSASSSGLGTSIVLGNTANGGSSTSLNVGAGGALILDGLSMYYAGTISDLSATNSNAVGNLNLMGGSFLQLASPNTFTGVTTITGVNSELQLQSSLALQDSTLNYNNQGGTIDFYNLTGVTLAGLTGSQNLSLSNDIAGGVTLTIGSSNRSSLYIGNLSGLGGVTLNATVATTTFQIGSGANGGASYSGITTINGGTLIIGGTGVSTTSAISLTGANGVANGLTVQDNAVLDSTGELYIQSAAGSASYPGAGTVLVTGSANVTATNLSFGNGSRVSADLLTIQGSASLIDNGFFDFDYNAGGGTNGTPTTFLDGGTLAVQKFQMTATPGAIVNPAIHFNGGTLEALASDPAGGAFLPAETGLTADVDSGGLIVDTNGFSITLAQALVHGTGAPDGGLTVFDNTATPGFLILTGANTYTGPTTINARATLQLGNGATGNDGTIVDSSGITDNGALIYDRFGTVSSGVPITGMGSVGKIGAGTQTLSANNGYTGPTTVSAGTLIVTGSLSATSSVSVSGGATLRLAASDALNAVAPITLANGALQNLSGQVQALGSLTLGTGASTLILGASSSVLDFLDSSASNWTGTLAISDWNGLAAGGGSDVVTIGTTADLSPSQLADITFINGTINGVPFSSVGAAQLADGEIVAAGVPEPGTWAMILGGLGALAIWQRSRRRSIRRV